MTVGPFVWGSLSMGMGELDESHGGTLTNKCRRAFRFFKLLQNFLLLLSSIPNYLNVSTKVFIPN
jgi:hypothetical protein